MKKNATNQYCLSILRLGIHHNKALANLVMALSSQKAASVVSLCESPVFHYQYSSICDAVHAVASDMPDLLKFERRFLNLVLNDYWEAPPVVYLSTDKTVVPKPQSPTLEGRTCVPISNPVRSGDKHLSVGYDYSYINLQGEGKMSLPLSARRVPLEKTASEVAGEQLARLLSDESLPLKDTELIINNLDCGYVGSGYVDAVKSFDNLVSCIRLRSGSSVWSRATTAQQKAGKVNKIYGQRYFLIEQSAWKQYKKHPKNGLPHHKFQTSIADKTPDEECWWEDTRSNGEEVTIRIRSYKDMIFRAHNGIRMDDKPCHVAMIEVRNKKNGELTFKKPLFLAFFGKKRDLCSTKQMSDIYAKRYNIEPFFRFAKQNMFMDKFQTPVRQHLDNWMYVLTIACWLLYIARKEILNQPKKWQQYASCDKFQYPFICSLSQAQKSILPYLLTFDNIPFLPLKSKGGPGRQFGMCQIQRTKKPYVKKNTKINHQSLKHPP